MLFFILECSKYTLVFAYFTLLQHHSSQSVSNAFQSGPLSSMIDR